MSLSNALQKSRRLQRAHLNSPAFTLTSISPYSHGTDPHTTATTNCSLGSPVRKRTGGGPH
eukprot:COSAG02_NODE_553_length_20425_cov_17.986372_4_plen_61_part_00